MSAARFCLGLWWVGFASLARAQDGSAPELASDAPAPALTADLSPVVAGEGAPGAAPVAADSATPQATSVTPVDAPSASSVDAELTRIDARLLELTRARPSLVPPLVLLITGGVIGIGASETASWLWLSSKTHHLGHVFGSDASRRDWSHRLEFVALGGFAIAAGGAFWLRKRLRARRPYKEEITQLKARRKQLLSGQQYGFKVDGRGGYGLWFAARF